MQGTESEEKLDGRTAADFACREGVELVEGSLGRLSW